MNIFTYESSNYSRVDIDLQYSNMLTAVYIQYILECIHALYFS